MITYLSERKHYKIKYIYYILYIYKKIKEYFYHIFITIFMTQEISREIKLFVERDRLENYPNVIGSIIITNSEPCDHLECF